MMSAPIMELRAGPSRQERPGERAGTVVLIAGVVGACLLAAVAARSGVPWAPSYLFAWLAVLGISLGCMMLIVVHNLTHGDWGDQIRPVCDAALRTFPATLLLALPLLFRLEQLFPWMRAANADGAELGNGMHWYLNVPFFLLRAALYFLVWLALSWILRPPAHRRATWIPTASSIGFVVLAFTVTFAAVDWMVSIAAPWRSTVFGLLAGVGQITAALAMAIIGAALLEARENNGGRGDGTRLGGRFHDLGNLTFALVMLWAYLALMQYIIIWIEDLPDETGWYLVRTRTSWGDWIPVLLLARFVVPFLALLSRRVKRDPAALASVATLLLAGCLVDTYWTVEPAFRPQGADFRWSDLLAPLAVWGVWGGLLLRVVELDRRLPGAARRTAESSVAGHP